MRTKAALLCILMLAVLAAASGCVVNKASTEGNASETVKENPWETADYNRSDALAVKQVILDHSYEYLVYTIEIKKPYGKNEMLQIEQPYVELVRGNYSEARLVVSMRRGPMTEQQYILYMPEDMPIY